MTRLSRKALLVSCLVLLSVAACKRRPVCGNGIVEHGEECDGDDPGGQTCADAIPGSSGILVCSSTCTFDTTPCVYCGNGRRDPGEDCDCGTDPDRLPAGCTYVNGGMNANCPLSCERGGECDDGVIDPGEDCDCGTDPDSLPAGCADVNGGPAANCDEGCIRFPECGVYGYAEPCDPLVVRDCCEDDWGVRPVCAVVPPGTDATCERECDDSLDCFWGDYCNAAMGNLCQPELCGQTSGLPNTEVNALCTVSGGGGQGWCAPLWWRDAPTDPATGACVQGNLGPGAACSALYGGSSFLGGADRAEAVCHLGLCIAPTGSASGICMQLCDWEAAYAVAFYGADPGTEPRPCPLGANCFAESFIEVSTGVRSGDLAYCEATEATDPANGMTTCSLVTGRLLANPALTCAEAGFVEGTCVMLQVVSGEVTNGSVVGVCADGPAAPNKAVWAPCDPDSPGDVCPVGSLCEKPDRFAPTPVMAERCVPRCDTAHPAGVEAHCADLGAVPTTDGTPFCQSLSLLFPPGGPLDILPTRLGLCGL